MAEVEDWVIKATTAIVTHLGITDELQVVSVAQLIVDNCIYQQGVPYMEAKEPPLLQCVRCHNTESCAGAMARQWQHGFCAHCGGAFKVVRA